MYEIVFSDIAKRQFDKLEKDCQERIGSVFERIKIRPEHFVQRLVNSPYYKLRIGEYRVILNVIHNKLVILVVEIGHRRNIYKKV
jgi:mRNA interferase RelE/StbE